MLLFKEMFNKNNQKIEFKIGSPIPHTIISDSAETHKQLSQRIRKHVLHIGKNKAPLLFN
ncbi:MAG: hypothetical protein QX195_10455 [Methylococcaceae bacterium]